MMQQNLQDNTATHNSRFTNINNFADDTQRELVAYQPFFEAINSPLTYLTYTGLSLVGPNKNKVSKIKKRDNWVKARNDSQATVLHLSMVTTSSCN